MRGTGSERSWNRKKRRKKEVMAETRRLAGLSNWLSQGAGAGEGLSLGKGRMVGGVDVHSGHTAFLFPVRLRRRAQQTAVSVRGERLDKDLGVSQREVRVEAHG